LTDESLAILGLIQSVGRTGCTDSIESQGRDSRERPSIARTGAQADAALAWLAQRHRTVPYVRIE